MRGMGRAIWLVVTSNGIYGFDRCGILDWLDADCCVDCHSLYSSGCLGREAPFTTMLMRIVLWRYTSYHPTLHLSNSKPRTNNNGRERSSKAASKKHNTPGPISPKSNKEKPPRHKSQNGPSTARTRWLICRTRYAVLPTSSASFHSLLPVWLIRWWRSWASIRSQIQTRRMWLFRCIVCCLPFLPFRTSYTLYSPNYLQTMFSISCTHSITINKLTPSRGNSIHPTQRSNPRIQRLQRRNRQSGSHKAIELLLR